MLVLFGRRIPRAGGLNIRGMIMGVWLVGGATATIGAMVGVQNSMAPQAPAHVQAGPIDDTIDYIDCLIRLLQGLDCDDQTTDPDPNTNPDSGSEPLPNP